MRRTGHDFQSFYFSRVGLGEGCGCAERVIDLFEADRRATTPLHKPFPAEAPPLRRRWRRFLNAAGLTRRARTQSR